MREPPPRESLRDGFMARDIANSQISFKSRTETPSRFEVTDAAGIQPNYIPDDMVE
jgi:hypothetical protein